MVDGVSIQGDRWCSPGKLSCRSLDFQVGTAEIDTGALFASQRITFRRPVHGVANVAFDGADFARFLAHPLVGGSARECGLEFARARASIDISSGVAFEGIWRGKPARAFLRRSSRPGGFQIHAGEGCSGEAEAALDAWFRMLRVDLDGPLVGPVRSLKIVPGVARAPATVQLQLDLAVTRFPSLPPKF
mmetsp:Transcript_8812/g.19621  ORF Transcript_8812/g.19621 Transcript_8812/m.19621 type:complete len:189 (-) Transcript_8812:209-775(-)